MKGQPSQSRVPDIVARTSAFSDTALREASFNIVPQERDSVLKRDDRLALVEELERGPYEFTPPSDDPDFLQLEPYSDIQLS